MSLLQVVRKGLDAAAACDVKQMELDLRETTVGLQCLGLLQCRILLQILDGSFSSALVASRQINQKGSVVERGLGVLQSELLNDGASDALSMLVRYSRRACGRV